MNVKHDEPMNVKLNMAPHHMFQSHLTSYDLHHGGDVNLLTYTVVYCMFPSDLLNA